MTTLVTGAAGFIGMHTALKLLDLGEQVVGFDNFTPYYDVALKQARVEQLKLHPNFAFETLDMANAEALRAFAQQHSIQRVVHLAAQPGVRYSLEHPSAYADSNLTGFINLLELCRHLNVEHLVYASSSSVYGANRLMPFSEDHPVDHPISLYAATKKANELMAHAYCHLFQFPATGLRFFTVYGPWGRPDMAMFKFTKAILQGQPIDVYNHGQLMRDFTYVDDIVESLVRTLDKPATPDEQFSRLAPCPSTSFAPHRVFNIGNAHPVALMDFIAAIERATGKTAIKKFMPAQPGDVDGTHANTDKLERWTGYTPQIDIQTGVNRFVAWYRSHYRV